MLRMRRLLGIGAAWTAALLGLWLAPSLVWMLPGFVRRGWFGWLVATGLAGYAVALWRGWKPHALARVDAASTRFLDSWLAIGLVVLSLVLLAGWAPHYLTWPWCRDVDTFATLARGWTSGVVPYRDVRAYNFPGHIYLHLLLGVIFRWNYVRLFYALDVVVVAAMGLLLVAWSRRCLGGALPGLAGFLGILGFYLGLEFEQVAERDWHTACLAVASIALAQAWPVRKARWVSACLLGIALVIRPHAVLFIPAAIFAVRSWRERAEWTGVCAGMACVLFLPIVLSGAMLAFLRGLSVAGYGGAYGRARLGAVGGGLLQELADPTTLIALSLLAASSWWSRLRREARAWLLALLGAIVYRPVHPVQHAYLEVPLDVVRSVALAIPVAWAVRCARLTAWPRLALVLLLMHQALPALPRLWRPDESFDSLGPILRGEPAARPPLGSLRFFHRLPPGQIDRPYEWKAYHDVMAYLRRMTTQRTIVANVLRRMPFPGLNGTIGRLSPFRAESGICWMWLVEIDLDAEFARALEEAPDSVVVWVSDEEGVEPRMQLPRLVETIRRLYEPEARFDNIEVWRRKQPARHSESNGDVLELEPADGAPRERKEDGEAGQAPPEGRVGGDEGEDGVLDGMVKDVGGQRVAS
jgi:hypothetical protein